MSLDKKAERFPATLEFSALHNLVSCALLFSYYEENKRLREGNFFAEEKSLLEQLQQLQAELPSYTNVNDLLNVANAINMGRASIENARVL